MARRKSGKRPKPHAATSAIREEKPFLPPGIALARAIQQIPSQERWRRRRAEEKALLAGILAGCSVSGTSAQTCEERAVRANVPES